jgi:hypothetical protein
VTAQLPFSPSQPADDPGDAFVWSAQPMHLATITTLRMLKDDIRGRLSAKRENIITRVGTISLNGREKFTTPQ